jgi:hypothetical protein
MIPKVAKSKSGMLLPMNWRRLAFVYVVTTKVKLVKPSGRTYGRITVPTFQDFR